MSVRISSPILHGAADIHQLNRHEKERALQEIMKQDFTRGIYKDVSELLPSLHEFTETELFKYALTTATGIQKTTRTYWNGKKETYAIQHDHRNMVVLEKCGRFQVIRYLQFYHRYHVHKPNLNVFEGEVQQIWIDTDTGKAITRTLNVRPFSNYSEQHFSLRSHLHFKGSNPVFSIDCGCVAIRSLHPTIRQHGLHGKNMHSMSTYHVVFTLLTENRFESMWKRGQQNVLAEMSRHYYSEEQIDAITTAAKIAHRNQYRIRDANLWLDLIDTLRQLRKDLHNAHYVCPDNLTQAHNRWYSLLEKRRDGERIRRDIEEAAKHEAEYHRRVGRWLGIMIQNRDFSIHVCQSVTEMKEEGRRMHHCVGGYYNHESALILLVRDKSGERIATTELNTDTWNIVQTRGHCNQTPELKGIPCKAEIDSLIMNNIDKFKKAKETNKTTIAATKAA